MQTILKGDIIQIVKESFIENYNKNIILCHGCNTKNVMGAGLAKQLREVWPSIYVNDSEANKLGYNVLGTYFSVCVKATPHNALYVLNMYTQSNFGRNRDIRYVSYDAIDDCFKLLVLENEPNHSLIYYPKIGAGLANGNWSIINEIINYRLKDYEHYLVEYE